MRLKHVLYVFVYILYFIYFSYAYTSLYNALPQKLSLNFKEIKQMPVILQGNFEKYSYSIYINGEKIDNNGVIKVYLTTRSGASLHNPFIKDNLDKAYLVLRNNEIMEVNEALINIEYYAPLETSHVYDVVIELLPLKDTSSYSLANGIEYHFKVYANAFVLSSHTSSYSSSSSGSYNGYVGEETDNAGDTNLYEHNSVNIFESNGSVVLNRTHSLINVSDNFSLHDVEKVESTASLNKANNSFINETAKHLLEGENASSSNFGKITGKATGIVNGSTLLIFILGSIALYILWKKL